MSNVKLVREKARLSARAEHLNEYAVQRALRFSAPLAGILDPYNFVYLRRGADKSESNVMQGNYQGCGIRIFDYSHTAAPDYYVEHRHTLMVLSLPADAEALPIAVITPENYLERYLVEMQEVTWDAVTETGNTYRLFGQDAPQHTLAFARCIAPFLKRHPRLYVECRGKALLAFYPELDLASTQDLDSLIELAKLLAPAPASADQ